MEAFTSIVKVIWLADDDPDDIEIFRDTLRELFPQIQLFTFTNGHLLIKALSTLRAPDLLFLDINMPLDGHQCLKLIRDNNKFRNLPVVVYSSSFRELDVIYSYGSGANLYIRKPSTYEGLRRTIEKVLRLDWSKPHEITKQQFDGDNYVPFTAQ